METKILIETLISEVQAEGESHWTLEMKQEMYTIMEAMVNKIRQEVILETEKIVELRKVKTLCH